MKESVVSEQLEQYFSSLGLKSKGKFNLFNHPDDDVDERTFIVDLAFEPEAKKGFRTPNEVGEDKSLFEMYRPCLTAAIDSLSEVAIFPTEEDMKYGWSLQPNPNPVVGLAVEIENNNKSKYFLGSLLAASIAGQWGLLIAEDDNDTDCWINTIRRMAYKGSRSPIPSNVVICKWRTLESHINKG